MEGAVVAQKIKFNYFLFFCPIYLIIAGFMGWCGVYTAMTGEPVWIVVFCWIFAAWALFLLSFFLYIGIAVARSPRILIVRSGDKIRCFVGKTGWVAIEPSEIQSFGENHVHSGNGGKFQSGTLRITMKDGRRYKVRGVKNLSAVKDSLLAMKVRAEVERERSVE